MGWNLHPHAAGHAEQLCHGMLVLPKEKRSSDTAPEPLTFRLLKASDEPSDNASRQRRTRTTQPDTAIALICGNPT